MFILSFNKVHYINSFYSSKIYQNDFRARFKSRILWDLLEFPIIAFRRLILGFKPKLWFPDKHKIIFFYQTKNNYNTIKAIQEITPDSVLLHTVLKPWSKGYLFPTGIAYLLALPFLPLAIYHMFISKGRQKIAFKSFFNKYWRSYGLLIAYRLYFRFIAPKAIVLTNHHFRDHLILSIICKNYDIPLFFIPHGSFSTRSIDANLMHFDFALVAGEDQKGKIEKGFSSAKIYIIGRPLSDGSLIKQNQSIKLSNLGVCFSLMDNFTNVWKLIDLISEMLTIKIVVRPHPGIVNLPEIATKLNYRRLGWSNSISEMPMDFLGRVDAIIAGCSGIILDAAEMNVYPIFYDFSHRYHDFNNFVKNGLAKFAASPEDCVSLLRQLLVSKPNVRQNAKYYNGTIGTPYDGKSTILARDIISEICGQGLCRY